MRRAAGAANDHRDIVLATGHIQDLRRLIDDLIDRHQRKVKGHHLYDRPQADHRRSDADAGEPGLADRGIDAPLRAELLKQTLADLIGPLVEAYLLPHKEYTRVPAHLFAKRLIQGLSIGNDRHTLVPSLSALRRRRPYIATPQAAPGRHRHTGSPPPPQLGPPSPASSNPTP